MKISAIQLSFLCVCFSLVGAPAQSADEQALFTLDESVWVTFYDLPSRRFRAIRDEFVRRDFQTASRNLVTAAGFLRVEAGRAVPELQDAINGVADKLDGMSRVLGEPTVVVSDLDNEFARAHWLLSQHYLVMALRSRDTSAHSNAGHYLWATAHHMERAVLWSNARIDRDVLNALDSIREMSNKLRDGQRPQRVYRDRPIRLAAQTLIAVGEHIDRNVRIKELVEPELAR